MNNISVIQNIKKVYSEPFPHICVEDALPENIYNELESSFPRSIIHEVNASDDITYRYKARHTLYDDNISNIWQDFFEYHTSLEYFNQCIALFEPYIEKRYGQDFVEYLYNNRITIRGIKKSPLVTDCQFVIHKPVGESSTTRTPHIDNPREIYAGLLYMRQPDDDSIGGNFTLHKVLKQFEIDKRYGRQVADKFHTPVKEVPYKRNTFCMFLNVLESIHSVTPRINPMHNRHSVNIIAEFDAARMRMWKVKEIK